LLKPGIIPEVEELMKIPLTIGKGEPEILTKA